jgi:hypothetical protein
MDSRSSLVSSFTALVAAACLAPANPQTPPPSGAPSAAPPAPATRAAQPAPPARLALLIGIDEYAAGREEDTPPSLLGAKTDVERVRRLLIDRFKFEDADIRVLFDKRATHEAIVRSFREWLIERAGPTSEVVVWFSGHGSRCPDAHPGLAREAGGLDSTFVAFDSRSAEHDGGFDVTDDEIYSLLRVLCARTPRVTVVTDSCHSGGVTRGGGGARIRFAPDLAKPLDWKRVEPFWPKDVAFFDDDRPERLEPLRCVLLAACTHDESAHEHVLTLPDGSMSVEGAFSHFLLEELERLEPNATYEQLLRRAGTRLSSLYRDQQPLAEGEFERVVFSADFGPPLPGFAAEVTPGSRFVRVEAGSLHLLRVGSILSVSDLGGHVLGRAQVRRIEPVSAVAEWLGDAPPVAEPTAVRATEVERPRGAAPLRLAVQEEATVQSVAAALEKSGRPEIEIVRGATRGGGWALRRRVDGPLELVTEPEGLELERGAAGRELAADDSLTGVLANEQRHRDLLALAAQPGTIPVSVELVELDATEARDLQKGHRAAHLVPPKAEFAGRVSAPSRVRVDPDGISVVKLRVRIDRARRERPAFISILCVSEDRKVTPLYPRAGERNNAITPGTELPVLIQVFETKVPGLRRVPLDRILVVATETYADLSPYMRDSAFRPAADPPAPTRGTDDLPEVLAQAFAPLATRGAGSIGVQRESFGIAALDFEVVGAETSAGAGK